MENRRDFLKKSGLLTVATLTGMSTVNWAKNAGRPIGLQLFTLFPSFDQDVKGNLQKIKAIGFSELESAFSMKGGFYGMTAPEFGTMVKDAGLTWRSHHVLGAPFKPRPGFDTSKMPKMLTLKTDSQEIVDTIAATGLKYLVCASIPHDTADEVKEGVDVLSKAGELASKAGLTLCYHNHDKEFADVGGQKPYDVFLSQIKPEHLKFELDLAWTSKAGVDPVALFQKHPGRFPLLHVKDFDKDFKNLMPVGEGVIDFKRIFESAKIGGVQHYFVEHDMPKDAMASITSSYAHLSKLI